MFDELTVVELTHDIKEHKLKEGDTGTVVLVYKNGKAYEVEFVAPNGRTIALLTLMPDEIRAYINKDEYVSRWFNHTPISLGTVSGMTFTESRENIWSKLDIVVSKDESMITTETFKSKANTEEFRYPTATV